MIVTSTEVSHGYVYFLVADQVPTVIRVVCVCDYAREPCSSQLQAVVEMTLICNVCMEWGQESLLRSPLATSQQLQIRLRHDDTLLSSYCLLHNVSCMNPIAY